MATIIFLKSLLKTEKAWYFGITPFFMCPIPSFPAGEGDEKYIHPVASRHPSRGDMMKLSASWNPIGILCLYRNCEHKKKPMESWAFV
jgi:hypothetical protein